MAVDSHNEIIGMQRDPSPLKFDKKFAYDIRNMRLVSEENCFALVNEKGTKKLINNAITDGTIVGYCTINDTLVIFTKGNTTTDTDKIYKAYFDDNDDFQLEELFSGTLFDSAKPIETLGVYETENVQKVYWVDGVNQPRVVNIKNIKAGGGAEQFDFVRALKLKEIINVTKNYSPGSFTTGTVQYVITYFTKYGQESHIAAMTDLNYISFSDRGGSPGQAIDNSFTINIQYLDINFDYVRIYSIFRTTENTDVLIKRVIDLKVPQPSQNEDPDTFNSTISFTDNNNTGDTVDSTLLFYIGGSNISAETLTSKDGVLFMGDIHLKSNNLTAEDATHIPHTVEWNTRMEYNAPVQTGFYPYKNRLSKSSNSVKGFKYLEYYRLGVQFQNKDGEWSNPLLVGDFINDYSPYGKPVDNSNNPYISIPYAKADLFTAQINYFRNKDYFKVRPVVVFPSIKERSCICQGVLCPTVYSLKNRMLNAPFVQSSWFTRPNAPYDINTNSVTRMAKVELDGVVNNQPHKVPDWIINSSNEYINVVENGIVQYPKPFKIEYIDPNRNYILVTSDEGLYALQGLTYGRNITHSDSSGNIIETSPGTYPIVGIHYSSINYYNNSDESEIVENRSFKKYDGVNTVYYKDGCLEFRHNYPIPSNDKRNAEIQNITKNDFPRIVRNASQAQKNEFIGDHESSFYIDQSIVTLHSPDIEFDEEVQNLDLSNVKMRVVGYVPITSSSSDIEISTNQSSYDTDPLSGFYKESIKYNNASQWAFRSVSSGIYWFDNKDLNSNDIWGFAVYAFHRQGSLGAFKKTTDNDIIYGDLKSKTLSNLKYSFGSVYFLYDPDNVINTNEIWESQYGISGAAIFNSDTVDVIRLPKPSNSGCPEYINYMGNIDSPVISSEDYYLRGVSGGRIPQNVFNNDYTTVNNITANDPVQMKYKSTPHAVVVLNNWDNTQYRQVILPTMRDENDNYINLASTNLDDSNREFLWDTISRGTHQQVLTSNEFSQTSNKSYGWLWLGELYRTIDTTTIFGGTSEDALKNNLWVVAGDAVTLEGTHVYIKWTEGDTYYQRYDHLKTYPFTQEDQNKIVDIVSFMCETRINLDGRYDRNRGLESNLNITPNNFNLLNKAYTQTNNYFQYNYLGEDFDLNDFSNSIVFSRPKNTAETTDAWTNINMTNILDLDGSKGKVRALKNFNNTVLAFQDKGIAQILYNENVQISSTNGTPIEIANSSRVQGKRYITTEIGCSNKWSITQSMNGVYFTDKNTKSIYLFNGELANLTDKCGMMSWGINNIDGTIWDCQTFDGIVTYYDKVLGDVMFITQDDCLAFSEKTGYFTGFFDYTNIPLFADISGHRIVFKNDSFYAKNEGDYNNFFNEYKSYWLTIIANGGNRDKTFSSIQFLSDTFDNNGIKVDGKVPVTFNEIEAWNEYQHGNVALEFKSAMQSSLKQKFRLWGAQLPRNNQGGRPNERLRNPWLKIKLIRNVSNNDNLKTVLHNIDVTCF